MIADTVADSLTKHRHALQSSESLRRLTQPRLTAYIPHRPTPKQRLFLCLPHREAFFGGAAGGGKSDCLLMGALQYVDIPGYAALIVRKTLTDASQPGSILFRARVWLAGTDAVWRGSENTWYFPSGATLKFGRLGQVGDAPSYQGSEYQYMGFDELVHFYEDDFEYVTSRLRAPICGFHAPDFDPQCPSCLEYGAIARVPLRIRTASNPGGLGGIWVKSRYDIKLSPGRVTPNGRPLYIGQNPERPHVPAFIEDNPFLDQQDYIAQLQRLTDPVTREQLLSGDWGVTAQGRFRRGWIRRYEKTERYVTVRGHTYANSQCSCFIMIDPAATTVQAPGSEELVRRQASYTVISAWYVTPHNDLLIMDVARFQREIPDIIAGVRSMKDKWRPQFVGMEFTSMSVHLFQLMQTAGYPMKAFRPMTQDKIARSADAATRMEEGKIFFPEHASWLQDWEDELFTWVGDRKQTDDQVDVLSYAAIYVSDMASHVTLSPADLPSA
jgi:predicted phage terminase large subunit-like protein